MNERATGHGRLARLGTAIADWGESDGASSQRPELPWRHTRDPWSILVAEVMAQQTQLSRVVPAYERFLAAFPTPVACAESSLGEVLQLWEGMGYYRRARDLHRSAQEVVTTWGGRLPDRLEALLALPGVGAYTARAVLVFAFEHDVGVVDTNAGRVVARAAAGRRLTSGEAQRTVDAMVPAGRGWTFGQALLDLGAEHCHPTAPDCRNCPVRRRCRWNRVGCSLPDPAVRSAGVSTHQPTFLGSDRQGRGRLMAALRSGPVAPDDVAEATGWSDDPGRADRIAAALVEEGLAVRTMEGGLALP